MRAPYNWILFLAALGPGIAAVVRVWDRWVALGLLGVLLLLGIFDQMRWQPWAYQYLLCLSPMMFVARSDDHDGVAAALDILRLIVIAIWELNVPMPNEDQMLLRVAKILVEELELVQPDYLYRDYPELLEERGFDIYSPVKIMAMNKFPPFRRSRDDDLAR